MAHMMGTRSVLQKFVNVLCNVRICLSFWRQLNKRLRYETWDVPQSPQGSVDNNKKKGARL